MFSLCLACSPKERNHHNTQPATPATEIVCDQETIKYATDLLREMKLISLNPAFRHIYFTEALGYIDSEILYRSFLLTEAAKKFQINLNQKKCVLDESAIEHLGEHFSILTDATINLLLLVIKYYPSYEDQYLGNPTRHVAFADFTCPQEPEAQTLTTEIEKNAAIKKYELILNKIISSKKASEYYIKQIQTQLVEINFANSEEQISKTIGRLAEKGNYFCKIYGLTDHAEKCSKNNVVLINSCTRILELNKIFGRDL